MLDHGLLWSLAIRVALRVTAPSCAASRPAGWPGGVCGRPARLLQRAQPPPPSSPRPAPPLTLSDLMLSSSASFTSGTGEGGAGGPSKITRILVSCTHKTGTHNQHPQTRHAVHAAAARRAAAAPPPTPRPTPPSPDTNTSSHRWTAAAAGAAAGARAKQGAV